MNKETYNLTDVYYSIYENGMPFGIPQETKEEAIRIYLEHIKTEEKLSDSWSVNYWKEEAKRHREALRSGNVQVKKTIKEIYVTEYLETIEEGV